VVQDSAGKTTKAHFVNKLFSNSNNRANLEILDQKVSQGIRSRPSNFENTNMRMPVVGKHDNAMTVTPDAQTWILNNLGFKLDSEEGIPDVQKPNRKMKRTFSARPGFRSNASERGSSIHSRQIPKRFERNSAMGDHEEPNFLIRNSSQKKRPMTAYSNCSRRSRVSSVKSAASFVQKMTRGNALVY